MRRLATIFLVGITFALANLSVVARDAEAPEPQPYTRIANPDTNTLQLQIALREFVPDKKTGPTIWLAGVMHIGEPGYYGQLQKFLDAQTVVLYEGVNTDAHPHHVHDPITTNAVPRVNTNDGYSMQSALARSLGLVFQLEAIDYDRTNFLNSDLSVGQLQNILTEGHPGSGSATNAPFDVLLQIMDGSSFLGSLVKAGLQFLGASPQLQAVGRLTLIETIGQLKGDLSDMQGLPPDWKKLINVLIAARNQNLLNDLGTELKTVPSSGSIAIFYGIGHMDDLEKHITSDLHYHSTNEMWLPAISADLRQSGISPAQAEWMGKLIQSQMEQLHTNMAPQITK